MEQEGVNAYDVRSKLGVVSLETRIEIRTLRRIGHITRMDSERQTKRVILGWPENECQERKKKGKTQTTIEFWRKVIRMAGVEDDQIEFETENRDAWRQLTRNREEHLKRYAES